MRKPAWRPRATALAAVIVLCACGGGNSNGGGNGNAAFPFTGPSCPPGTQPVQMSGGSSDPACQSCVQDQCNVLQCVTVDCAGYFRCACGCNPGDPNCLQGCVTGMSSDCTDCLRFKIPECLLQTCGGACGVTSVDAGFAVQCSLLASCCATLPQGTTEWNTCDQTVNRQDDFACQQALSSYKDGGMCR